MSGRCLPNNLFLGEDDDVTDSQRARRLPRHHIRLIAWDGILMPPHMEVIDLHNVSSSLDRRLAMYTNRALPGCDGQHFHTLRHLLKQSRTGESKNGVGVRKGERW